VHEGALSIANPLVMTARAGG